MAIQPILDPDTGEVIFDPSKAADPGFQPPESTTTAPDLTTAVEGWRAWSVSRELPKFGVSPKLCSATFRGYYWTPRKAAQAHCDRCVVPPGDDCGCGFYTARTLEHLLGMSYPRYSDAERDAKVIGKVANWGKVIECSQGWRSQFSYPVRLFLPYECHYLLQSLSEGYGIPVSLLNWLKPAEEVIRIMKAYD